jgi:hypothetical protein
MDNKENSYSQGDYKRLSKRIRENPNKITKEDYQMLQEFRLTYRSQLSTIFTFLNKEAQKIDKESVCTYRIKRIESIVSKLGRYKMPIYKMNDIAGCRCIMTSDKDVIKLFKRLQKTKEKLPFKFELRNNYIETPKEDGYRSIHLIATLKDEPEKIVEVQIRSLEQHNWATLVEISDVLFDSKLKECRREKSPELFDFHLLLAKKDRELTFNDKQKICEISGKFRYIERLSVLFFKNYISLRTQRNELKANRGSFYFLISTDNQGRPELIQFKDFNEAEKQYFEMFLDNPESKNIVLTHFKGTSFDKISIAYSNYVMTYNATLFRVLKIIGEMSVHAFNHYQIRKFKKYYRAFWYIVSQWFDTKVTEADLYNKDKTIKKSITKNKEWSSSISSSIANIYEIVMEKQMKFKKNILFYFIKRTKYAIDNEYKKVQLFFLKISKL